MVRINAESAPKNDWWDLGDCCVLGQYESPHRQSLKKLKKILGEFIRIRGRSNSRKNSGGKSTAIHCPLSRHET